MNIELQWGVSNVNTIQRLPKVANVNGFLRAGNPSNVTIYFKDNKLHEREFHSSDK